MSVEHVISADSLGERNIQFSHSDQQPKPHSGDPAPAKALSETRQRAFTNIEDTPVQTRTPHKYVVRRPRALQVSHQGHTVDTGDSGKIELTKYGYRPAGEDGVPIAPNKEKHAHHSDSVRVQRGRLDLFIDLLWIAIISNISEHYYTSAFAEDGDVGYALSEFILLFLPAWALWFHLQQFLNNYYMDDTIQRMIIIWILILGLTWGNNAPFFLNNVDNSNFLIVSYLVAIATIRLTELMYSIFVPWIRRQFFVEFILTLPSAGLWISASVVENINHKTSLITAAVVYEYTAQYLMRSPVADYLLGTGLRKTQDLEHTIQRYESFFIIALGEGVILLIRNSPAGAKLSSSLGTATQAFLLYYFWNWIYFLGDGSRRSIHPMHRRWWIRSLWQMLHIPLFMSLVLLSSGTLYLVKFRPEAEASSSEEVGPQSTPPGSAERLLRRAEAEVSQTHDTLRVAYATMFISSAVSMACMLVFALLGRSLDEPKTLVISNRYLRLIPRAAAVPVLATIWIHDFDSPNVVLGWLLLVVWVVGYWEIFSSMDRGVKFFEPAHPKGLTPTSSNA